MAERSNFTTEEIGTIRLMETATLKIRIVNNRDLDIRLWLDSDEYSGPTKKGVRFSLLDDAWIQFKGLMEIVNEKQKKLQGT